MAEPETDKVNPNPEAAKTPGQGAANATVPMPRKCGHSGGGNLEAGGSAGLASTWSFEHGCSTQQRPRFVWVIVTAF